MTGQHVQIGLTGGMGSGKTTVGRMLAARGALVVDADEVAREIVASGTEGLAEIVERFGEGVLHEDGSLDRAALGQLAFASRGSRRALESITHPRIAARTEEIMSDATEGQVVVHDIPLLVELHREDDYDLVVVVDAPVEIRLERLKDRGVAPDVARARMEAQATTQQRRAVADVWIENDGDEEQLQCRVEELWAEQIEPLRIARQEEAQA